MIDVLSVERRDGKAIRAEFKIGGIQIGFVRFQNKPMEEYRLREDSQIADTDSTYIPKADYRKLLDKVKAIFSEDRVKKSKAQPSPTLF